ncbi:MAG TPA: hypothetical protein VG889_08955 [Rhizomicrobium sp.]|nr:hypothetical protein [Rhizomicrobium sp.]
MSDILVVEKSDRQRKVEPALLYIVPPVVALACRIFLGPGFRQIPLILLQFALQSLVGHRIALGLGGERVTPEERRRHDLHA